MHGRCCPFWVFIRYSGFLLAGAILLAGLGACARLNGESDVSPLTFTLQLNESNLHPNDALIVFAWVRNLSRRTLTLQMPDASSVEFFVSGPSGAVRARPVVSKLEPMGLTYPVAGGHALPERRARAFVFTTVTQKPGDYHILGIYHPAPKGAVSELAPVISKSEAFKVEGPPRLQRDRDGILLKETAIEIAKRHAGRTVSSADALLLEADNGFLLWRVALAFDPQPAAAGTEANTVLYVNPYLGGIMPIGGKPAAAKKEPAATPLFEPIQILPPAQQAAPAP
ncbi:MAG: hypothetical protein N3D11_11160 [Candidatus Sumerlaeia bacterium]|nr:hypothetical protein [Candidatus Sumerlaeia bacterium]